MALRHGHAKAGAHSRTYQSWTAMMNRCTNPKNDRWPWYGARGIGVCRRWLRFESFLADMGERPEGTTLDRKRSNGHYTPGNCRWATPKQQASNRRGGKLTKQHLHQIRKALLRGVTALELASKFNVSRSHIYNIKNGYRWLQSTK